MAVPVATISGEGGELAQAVAILSIEITREINRIPEARLTLQDGNVADRVFALSNGAMFEPGKSVSIALRYEGDGADTILFEGLVVKQDVEVRPDGSVLEVELKDATFKLTRPRRSLVHRDQTDRDAIGQLIQDAGLELGELASTTATHQELVQYRSSDWDFMVSRAEANGMALDADRGTVSLRTLELAAEAELELEYGLSNIHELKLSVDASEQLADVAAVGWDIAQQVSTEPEIAEDPRVAVGNLDTVAVAQALAATEYTLLHAAPLPQAEIKAWADGHLRRTRFAMLRGRIVVDGDPTLTPLCTVQLSGVSDRFNGKGLISAVTHRLNAAGWQTELTLGVSTDAFARRPDVAEPPAAGLLPAIANLQIATVAAFEEDPEHRIKLKLPGLDDEQGFVWARVARPDAGADRGFVFWPEENDEVVVGFLGGDPRQAVVLGALHSSANAPPAVPGPPNQDNHVRAIVSRGGTMISFDDEKNVVTIKTPGNNAVVIDDDSESISLKDQHGNELTMSSSGVTLKSASDLAIEASGAVKIKGSSVDVQ